MMNNQVQETYKDEVSKELFESLEYLVERYIKNKNTEYEFIACITPDGVPWYWQRAKQAVERYKEVKY